MKKSIALALVLTVWLAGTLWFAKKDQFISDAGILIINNAQ
jgi:hypothetical protein